MILLIISVVFLLIALIYFGLTQKFKYFAKRGIPSPKVKIPFGHTKEGFLGKRNVIYDIDDVYRHYKGKSPFVGFFMTLSPYFLILDSELVKKILIQDFGTFRNNDFGGLASEKKDPTLFYNPFLLTDDRWKEKRAEVTPSMSQNRLKSLYPLVVHVTKKLSEHIREERSPLDARDVCARYTCDAIANCLFGIDALSLSLASAELYDHSQKILRGVMAAMSRLIPRRIFPADSAAFFAKLVKDAIKYRADNKVERDDFLAQLIASQQKKNLPEVEVVAQAWTYYMDSFETAALGLHFVLYELARDKRVQTKLREELLASGEGDCLEFEKLIELEYLDQVVNEALRLHPPLLFTTRVCSENYELDGAKGHKFTMLKGEAALIPIYCIHRDQEYYPHPDSFEPERFDAEHGGVKAFRDKAVLMPFGLGPRVCLGMKWANVLLKSAIVEIIKNFSISVDEKVLSDPKIDAKEPMNVTECKLMLNFENIKN